jgi:hypothetical protein
MPASRLGLQHLYRAMDFLEEEKAEIENPYPATPC